MYWKVLYVNYTFEKLVGQVYRLKKIFQKQSSFRKFTLASQRCYPAPQRLSILKLNAAALQGSAAALVTVSMLLFYFSILSTQMIFNTHEMYSNVLLAYFGILKHT